MSASVSSPGLVGCALHLGGDRPRDVAGVEHVGALGGHLPQHRRERRVAQPSADGHRSSVRRVEVRACIRIGRQRLVVGDQPAQPWADREAVVRRGEWPGAKNRAHGSAPYVRWASASMRSTPGAPTDRPPTMASAVAHGHAVAQEQRVGGCCRRGLAAVERRQRPTIPVQQERPAADAARLWLDQRQHHLDGNGGVDRAVPPASSISAPAAVASGLAAATIQVDADQPGLSVQPLAASGGEPDGGVVTRAVRGPARHRRHTPAARTGPSAAEAVEPCAEHIPRGRTGHRATGYRVPGTCNRAGLPPGSGRPRTAYGAGCPRARPRRRAIRAAGSWPAVCRVGGHEPRRIR